MHISHNILSFQLIHLFFRPRLFTLKSFSEINLAVLRHLVYCITYRKTS